MSEKKSGSSSFSAGSAASGSGSRGPRIVHMSYYMNRGWLTGDGIFKIAPTLDSGSGRVLLVSGPTTSTNTPATPTGKDSEIVEDFYKARKPRKYKGMSPALRSGRTGLMVAQEAKAENGTRPPNYMKRESE